MCNHQKLCFKNNGYIIRCSICNNYQIAFETTMLTINDQDFVQLKEVIDIKVNEECYEDETIKSLVIATPFRGNHILLSKKELLELHELFEEADNERQALELINLFNQD